MKSPKAVVESLVAGLIDRERTGLSLLYAEDAVVEHPFAVSGPVRIEGRAALHERFQSSRARSFTFTVHDVVVRETDDPEVVVVEYDYEIELSEAGKQLRISNILVVRVRDGLIVHSKDFHDHHALAAAIGPIDS
ncbi:MAG: nuclear transport factor 2 family protein [Kibdelosporangium sp.]